MRRPKRAGPARLVAACAAALALATGGLARGAGTGGTAPGPPPGSRAFALELAHLRKVASPGGSWPSLHEGTAEPSEAPAKVTVWPGEPGRHVPEDFLGLSFESTTLSTLPSLADGGTLTRLLGTLGRGTLRFGGGSVNRYVAWEQPGTPRPPWATHPVTAADLRALASIARRRAGRCC